MAAEIGKAARISGNRPSGVFHTRRGPSQNTSGRIRTIASSPTRPQSGVQLSAVVVGKCSCVFAVVLVTAVSAAAQASAGNLAAVESQIPKTGSTQQYEQGRKQKAD